MEAIIRQLGVLNRFKNCSELRPPTDLRALLPDHPFSSLVRSIFASATKAATATVRDEHTQMRA